MEQFQTPNYCLKWIITLILLHLFIVPSIVLSEITESDDIKYTFIKKADGYSFQFRINLDANPECLLSVIFEYAHFKNFTKNVDSIKLLKSDADSNIIRYSYDRFLFKHTSTYLRILCRDKNMVTFEMIENELHKSIFPKIIASKGYYKILSNLNKSTIEYFQEAVIEDKNFNSIYLYFIKNEALDFAINLKQYAQSECSL